MTNYYDDDEEDEMSPEPEVPAGVSLGRATPKRDTAQALLVIREDLTELWVPKSCIHDDSECYSMKSGPGKLIVVAWWAEKQGLTT